MQRLRGRRHRFTYVAYGLGFRSSLELPELASAAAGAGAVEIRYGPVARAGARATALDYRVRRFPRGLAFIWEDVGALAVSRGRLIRLDPVPGADERLLRLAVLGPGLGTLLRQRGELALHGSAVVVSGRGALFIGQSGWGKSTLAAALYGRGHAVLADDMALLALDGDLPAVVPGYPQLRLWPDALGALGIDSRPLPRLHPRLEKRGLPVPRGFPAAPVPLQRIYVLAEGPGAAIEPIPPREAFLELVRHTYGARLLGPAGAESQFPRVARVAREVSIRRLASDRGPDAPGRLAALVEHDLAGA